MSLTFNQYTNASGRKFYLNTDTIVEIFEARGRDGIGSWKAMIRLKDGKLRKVQEIVGQILQSL